MTTVPPWIWIPIVLGAAAAQTVRNAAQRSLIQSAGTLPATLVRFIYGLPFTILGCVVALQFTPGPGPQPNPGFLLWVSVGALMQLLATAFLLAAMKQRSFIVAVVFSKTELLQIAVLSVVLLHDPVSLATVIAVLLATVGVLLLSAKKPDADASTGWFSPAAGLGLASGASFALSAVAFRGAALSLGEMPPWTSGTYALLWAQAEQSVALAGYLAWRDRRGLKVVLEQWRVSTLAGFMGSAASMGWLTAFAMRGAAEVRTVGLAEVLLSYVVTRRIFKERVHSREIAGIVLVASGILVVSTLH